MCEVYGYVIAHPEEVIYNAAYCYHAYYGLKTGPLVVLLVLSISISESMDEVYMGC